MQGGIGSHPQPRRGEGVTTDKDEYDDLLTQFDMPDIVWK